MASTEKRGVEPTDSRRVELFVRSLGGSHRAPTGDHLDRLRGMASEGYFELSVSVWGREVGLSTTAARTDDGRFVLDRVAAFREWADEHDVELEPFFRTREVRSDVTGRSYTALVLPVTCVAEYRGDELVHVSPYATGTAVHTVIDHLDRLETNAAVGTPTPSDAEPANQSG